MGMRVLVLSVHSVTARATSLMSSRHSSPTREENPFGCSGSGEGFMDPPAQRSMEARRWGIGKKERRLSRQL